jgi:hypothetical protein
MNYQDVISARETAWQSDVRKLICQGLEFVVVHVAPKQFNDCQALAQEFDYTTLHEDRSVIADYPEVLPTIVGFAKRTSIKRILI